jgi:hypothetical protein
MAKTLSRIKEQDGQLVAERYQGWDQEEDHKNVKRYHGIANQ